MALTWTYYPQDSDPITVPNFKDEALNNPGATPDRMFNSSDVADSNIRNGGKGVVRGYANEFSVSQSVTTTTQLEVQSGTANCWGYTLTGKGDFDTIDVLTLPANANRIDVLVLKFDPTSTRTNYLTWHQGIEASSPIAPTVDEYEIALANVELEPTNGIVSVDDSVKEYLVGDYYDKEESDNLYVKKAGDTMTGQLVINSGDNPLRIIEGTRVDGINVFEIGNSSSTYSKFFMNTNTTSVYDELTSFNSSGEVFKGFRYTKGKFEVVTENDVFSPLAFENNVYNKNQTYTQAEVNALILQVQQAPGFSAEIFSGNKSVGSSGSLSQSFRNFRLLKINYSIDNGSVSGTFDMTPTNVGAFYKGIISLATETGEPLDIFLADVLIQFNTETSFTNLKARAFKLVSGSDNNVETNYKANMEIVKIEGYK